MPENLEGVSIKSIEAVVCRYPEIAEVVNKKGRTVIARQPVS
jgi:hypothetical protein